MSYLKFPRLHFSGKFQAAPSTVNNTPNNYNTNNFYGTTAPGDTRLDHSSNPIQLKDVELYWNPNGNGIFDLIDCTVTKVMYEDGTESITDPIVGQSVAAVYAKAPPKIVDLDPMQQNVSEVWGLDIQIAGTSAAQPHSIPSFIRGTFAPTPFTGIWVQSQNGPRSSASGSAVYQAQLTNVDVETSTEKSSKFINDLKNNNPTALSMNVTVNAHNNSPQIYSFNRGTIGVMLEQGVPLNVTNKLGPLTEAIQNVGSPKGDIPTESFVNHMLSQLLEKPEATQYGPTILAASKQEYSPSGPNPFTHGDIVGVIGLGEAQALTYVVPSRMMAPYEQNPLAFFAPFEVSSNTVTVNLGNSLATSLPGPLAYEEKLGVLSLVYFDVPEGEPVSLDQAKILATIPYQGSDFKTINSGFFTYAPKEGEAEKVGSKPLGIISEVSGTQKTLLLAENKDGYFMRADRFVYRMNPGMTTIQDPPPGHPTGATADIHIYVTKFGQKPTTPVEITLTSLSPQKATNYSANTVGQGGTLGTANLAVPESALGIGPQYATTYKATTVDGVATFNITAFNPGNPRGYIDGQIYFLDYEFTNIQNYIKDKDDLISIQVYQQLLNGKGLGYIPTWDGEIRDILAQYGKLYPIMSRFGLQNYESVVMNKVQIKNVLKQPIEAPLHMPVTRDLSHDKLQLILTWMDKNTPRTQADIAKANGNK